MKKLRVILIALFAMVVLSTQAQDAIGLRFAGGNGSSAEISYQKGMSDANRLQLDLGLNLGSSYTGLGLTGTYQWTFGLADVDGLGWFVGPGATASLWSYKDADNYFNIGLGGIIGIDYEFEAIPIQLSLDIRPMFNVIGYNGLYWDGALAIRYVF